MAAESRRELTEEERRWNLVEIRAVLEGSPVAGSLGPQVGPHHAERLAKLVVGAVRVVPVSSELKDELAEADADVAALNRMRLRNEGIALEWKAVAVTIAGWLADMREVSVGDTERAHAESLVECIRESLPARPVVGARGEGWSCLLLLAIGHEGSVVGEEHEEAIDRLFARGFLESVAVNRHEAMAALTPSGLDFVREVLASTRVPDEATACEKGGS